MINGVTEDFAGFNKTVSSATISSALEYILCDYKKLKEIAARSYAHDNGFFKMVIHNDTERDVVGRLHLWDNSIRPFTSDMNIHNHRWDFSSRVLSGEAHHTIYRPDSGSDNHYTQFTYSRERGGKGYSLRKFGAAGLKLLQEGRLHVGSAYYLESSVLHRMIPISNQLLTFVCNGPIQSNSTSVYTEHKSPLGSGNITPLGIEQLRSILQHCLQLTMETATERTIPFLTDLEQSATSINDRY